MGNETSQITAVSQLITIGEKPLEATQFWTHYAARSNHDKLNQQLSVFVGDLSNTLDVWNDDNTSKCPLERYTKNLMVYRHPNILKYNVSWQKDAKCYLAVEHVVPLAQTISSLSTLQICIGLQSIAKALMFLHDNAKASHNNLGLTAIYVANDGSWKLGGFEFLCNYSQLTHTYLKKTRVYRSANTVDPHEDNLDVSDLNSGCVDVYAFAAFALELLDGKSDDDQPGLKQFKQQMMSITSNSAKTRPNLKVIMAHTFFNHDFISVQGFLNDLLTKTDVEKSEFFAGALNRLNKFPEITVAAQLGGLLLARGVLLDATAQRELIPYVLQVKQDSSDGKVTAQLFSKTTFQQYIVPKLLQVFLVRDLQIRLVLLAHFEHYSHCFTNEQLQNHILPELLLGIKDVDDELVATTLMCLSHLVSILGSTVVIGWNRKKIFADCRPVQHTNKKHSRRRRQSDLKAPTLAVVREIEESDGPNHVDENRVYQNHISRVSPDGDEGDGSFLETNDEDWCDWDDVSPVNPANLVSNGHVMDESIRVAESSGAIKPKIMDILDLDIKSRAINGEEFNFFEDMEPVIDKTSKVVLNDANEQSLRLNVSDELNQAEDGWGLDWDEECDK